MLDLLFAFPIDWIALMITKSTALTLPACFTCSIFWLDLLFAFPFDWIALLITKSTAAARENPKLELYVSMIKFMKMGRMYRVLQFFSLLDKKMVVSDIALMLIRNWMVGVAVTAAHMLI